MLKQVSIIIVFMTILSLFFTLWQENSVHLITFLNILFACALGLTIIGATIHILSSGFFQTYIHHVKKVFSQFSKAGQMADQLERKDKFVNDAFFEFPFTVSIIIAGITLTIISSVISIIMT
ncbi:MAG TPA: DUF3899 domain-containing protein [Pseudogracilibacillus sp.]|nr:DUF3899 domain-containing protein [Pseudogracilibacillus sp.]